MKSVRLAGPAEQSLNSSRGFNHCWDFTHGAKCKGRGRGTFSEAAWGQWKYEMVKSKRLVLSNQYCTINTLSALIQLAEWSEMNVQDKPARLKRGWSWTYPKEKDSKNKIPEQPAFGIYVQSENITWARMLSEYFWNLHPRLTDGELTGTSTSFSTTESSTMPKFCSWSLLSCLLNIIAPQYTENKENYRCKELTACRGLLTCITTHTSSANAQSDLAPNYENNREEEAGLRKELADREKEVF